MLRIIVAVFSLAIFLSSATSLAQEPVKVSPPQQKILTSENGRFVFGQISDFRRDQFMLDTKTGRLWQIVVRASEKGASEDGLNLLEPVPYSNLYDDKLSFEPR